MANSCHGTGILHTYTNKKQSFPIFHLPNVIYHEKRELQPYEQNEEGKTNKRMHVEEKICITEKRSQNKNFANVKNYPNMNLLFM